MPAKTIVITGASAGIGAATARVLAREKPCLVLAARRVEKLEQVAAECRVLGAQTLVAPCDVAHRGDVDRLVQLAVEKFGRLDVMLANAGFGELAKVHEMPEEDFDAIFATNVKGTWYAMQAAARVMLSQAPTGRGRARRGHIIAVSSGAARRGMPLYGVYAMTKAAQLSLAEAMRVELAPQGVYVSTVHPLTTATEFFDVASSKSRYPSGGIGPTQSAQAVGRKIARLIRHPKPELWPMPFSHFMLAFACLFPRVADWTMAKSIGQRTRSR